MGVVKEKEEGGDGDRWDEEDEEVGEEDPHKSSHPRSATKIAGINWDQPSSDDENEDTLISCIPPHVPDLPEARWNEDESPVAMKEPETQHTRHPELLVTTEVLHSYGLVFHCDLKLIICSGCQEGIPLSHLFNHLAKVALASRSRWNDHTQAWEESKVAFDHEPSTMRLPPLATFLESIVNSLIADAYIDSVEEILTAGRPFNNWSGNEPQPVGTDTLPAPIAGLRVFHTARKCVECGMITPMPKTMNKHWSTKHRGVDVKRPKAKQTTRVASLDVDDDWQPDRTAKGITGKWTVVPVSQTLSESLSLRHYFEVQVIDEPEAPVGLRHKSDPTPSEQEDADFCEAEQLLRQKKLPLIAPLESVPKDIRTILPVYVTTGIDNLLSKFDRSTVQAPYQLDRNDPRVKALRVAGVLSYKEDVQALADHKLHDSVCARMTNCTP